MQREASRLTIILFSDPHAITLDTQCFNTCDFNQQNRLHIIFVSYAVSYMYAKVHMAATLLCCAPQKMTSKMLDIFFKDLPSTNNFRTLH
jgi:hypothetical protein